MTSGVSGASCALSGTVLLSLGAFPRPLGLSGVIFYRPPRGTIRSSVLGQTFKLPKVIFWFLDGQQILHELCTMDDVRGDLRVEWGAGCGELGLSTRELEPAAVSMRAAYSKKRAQLGLGA